MAWPFSGRAAPVERVEPTFQNASTQAETSISSPEAWLIDALGGGPTYAGPLVNETSAMRSSTVFRCVALKAGLIASIPLNVYKRTGTGREEANLHRMYPLLHDEPSDLMSSFIWKELITANLMLAGNHYSIIETDNASRTVGLIPVPPQVVTPFRLDGRHKYTIRFNSFTETFDQDEIIHVPGLGFDGIKGLSPIAWAGKQAVGIGLAMEEMIGRLYGQSATPSGVVTLGTDMKDKVEAFKRMRAEFNALYSGVQNTGRTMFLDNGATWSPMQISPQDMQTLESRRFQVADICRLFGVPPHMVGETDKTTSWGTGIEQQFIGFLLTSIDPDLCRVEGELNRKLFKAPYYCEFDRDTLRAMDTKTMAELFSSGVQNAGYTPNEVRAKRNLPPMPGGDKLYIQSATVPLEMAGKVAPQPAPKKPPQQDPAPPAPGAPGQ